MSRAQDFERALNGVENTKRRFSPEVNKTIESIALNPDLILDMSIYGRTYELVHRNQND